MGRFKVGAWLVGEDRDTAFDGSTEVDNPLRERTRILLPLATFDVRLTERVGLQAAAAIPDTTRTASIVGPAGTPNYRENFRGPGDTSVLAWYRVTGASLTRNREPWTHFASVAARTPLYENRHGLRTGASFEINAGAARSVWTHKVALFGRLGWLHRQQDVFRGTPVLVGGGNWLYATPGIGMLAGKGLNVQAK